MHLVSVKIDFVLLKMCSINLNILLLSCMLSLSRTMSDVVSDSISNLLVISFDGFRPDFFDRGVTPNMNKIRKRGVSTDYMRATFPTKTLPNHFSIATGMYAGTHGVTGKKVFDRKLMKEVKYGYELYHYNERIRPIWTLNQRAGKYSGCMMWSGTNFPYDNVNCTFVREYNSSVPWTDRVNTALSWFNDSRTPASLVMLYIEYPDKLEHLYSPDSENVTQNIAELDALVGYLQTKLQETGLKDHLNIIYLSDHGMGSISSPYYINLTSWLEPGSCEMYGTSPVLQIVPAQGKEYAVLKNLTEASNLNGHFKVYSDETLPDKWKYQNLQRCGPITAVADINYGFQDRYTVAANYETEYSIANTKDQVYGIHGYDNMEPSMHAIFFAEGPMFKKEHTVAPFNNIDLYNLFCLVLDILPDANNGTLENVLDIVQPIDGNNNKWQTIGFVLGGVVVVSCATGALVYWFKKRKVSVDLNHSSSSLSPII